MSVDYFLIEAPRSVPAEFAAWEAARLRWHVLADRVFSCKDWSGAGFAAMNARAIEAKQEADALELKARAAFSVWMRGGRA